MDPGHRSKGGFQEGLTQECAECKERWLQGWTLERAQERERNGYRQHGYAIRMGENRATDWSNQALLIG